MYSGALRLIVVFVPVDFNTGALFLGGRPWAGAVLIYHLSSGDQ
jgi:hypothetical protein